LFDDLIALGDSREGINSDRRISMSIDKNNPAGASDDPTGAQTESLESTELEDVELETISGGSCGPNVCGLPNKDLMP
jgi:hypothetical protein